MKKLVAGSQVTVVLKGHGGKGKVLAGQLICDAAFQKAFESGPYLPV